MKSPPRFDIAIEDRVIAKQLAARMRDSADRPFIRVEDAVWSYREVDALSRAFARGLLAQGVQAGDHVVLMLPNCAEFVFAWLGTALIGAIIIPIDPRLSGALLEYMLVDSRPRCLVVAQELLPALGTAPGPILARIPCVVVVPDATQPEAADIKLTHRLAWRDMLIASGPDPERAVSYRDVAMVMYTSGSTGAPKGVIMTSAHTFSSGMAMVRGVALDAQDVIYAPLPLFHGMSSRIGVLPALMLGACVAIAKRFSASGYWQQAADCEATVALVVPTMPGLLMAQEPSPFDRAHQVRALFNAPRNDAFEARFGTMLVESYGITEIGHVISAPLHERRPGSCGRIQPLWQVRLVNEDGAEVAQGEVGEVTARPTDRALMLQGYLNKPEATNEAIRDGWFHAADYGYFDADGYFFFSFRKAERIRRIGESISGQDIEGVVAKHPAVAECAALPCASSTGEDEIRLVVVLQTAQSLTAHALHQWLQTRLPRFMIPRFIEFAQDLPRTESGKVAKRVLITAGLSATAWDSTPLPHGAAA